MDRGDFKALAQFRNELGSDYIEPDLKTALDPIPSVSRAAQDGDVATTRRVCPLVQPPSFKRDLCLLAFTHVGDLDDAFSMASQIFPDRIGKSSPDQDRIWLDDPYPTDTDILTESAAAPLRRDPRFLALVRRLGMVAYWMSGRLPDFCRPPHPEAMCRTLAS